MLGCLLGTEHYLLQVSLNIGPSFLVLDPRRAEGKGEKVPSVGREKKRWSPSALPQLPTYACIYLESETGRLYTA